MVIKWCLIFLLVFEVHGNNPLRYCEEKWLSEGATLYRLNDQLVQLSYDQRYSGQPYQTRYEVLVLFGCRSDKPVDAKTFDPEEIFANVYQAEIWNVDLPPMPESSQLNEVILRDAIPNNVWGSCSALYYLYIQRVDLTNMPSDWLSNCTLLRRLDLESMTAAQASAVLDTAPVVEQLSMTNIESIAGVLVHPLFPTPRGREKNIFKLELNALTESESLPENVSWVDVSGAVVWQISSLTALKELYMSFKHFDFCAVSDYPAVTFNLLEHLEMSYTNTAHFCFKTLRIMPNLTNARFFFNLFNELQFSELYSSKLPELSVSFDKRIRPRLQFTRDDYLALNDGIKKGHITLSLRSTIECDCGQSLWLARALREGLITDLEVTCVDGSLLSRQECEMLECDRLLCDGPCICCRGTNGTIDVDCRDTNLYELPMEVLLLDNVSSLLAPNVSHLSTLPRYLPNSLTLLDLSGNNVLLKAYENELATLFQVSRRVRLAGNGVVCSCDSKPVLQVLEERSDQIEDYEKLVCVDDGKKLKEVDFGTLCAKQDRQRAILSSVSGAFILAAMALTLGVFLYYKKELKIFLFARGWCLCLVKEDELDADRRYDVFLSFCHEDAEFILEQLLPILDKEYSVCVHLRDWFPGEMILTQITNSILQSKRTVVVVSRNFVKSLWGLLEFRTAHSSGLVEGRVRLVMVILDDILEEDQLEEEIRSYVRMNTYVRWGDPWFWDKLRYALPHNPRPRVFLSGTDGFADNRPGAVMIEFPM